MKFWRNPQYQSLRHELTPEHLFFDRRKLMATMGMGAAAAAVAGGSAFAAPAGALPAPGARVNFRPTSWKVDDATTPEEAVTGYNNFYEFGTNKDDPARYSGGMTVSPWAINVEGECEKPGHYDLASVVDYSKLEERIYRHRCVEAWSMVIPWVGVPLAGVLAQFKPTSRAKFVQFETYLNRKEMPGTNFPVLRWPYVEGLRMDEAMNELAFLAVGVFGKALPRQNGAPVRTVLPWKYGFKSTKSLVAIRFLESQPRTSWNQANPDEYGFYSNVNPHVDHPRWSQASERVIGGKGFSALTGRRKTDMFNGYEQQVSNLYAGMDLRKYY
ncbi:MAG: protein-methionine-sulfoxide reductase catalytic subunit MsrP [Alphaproteobacteria bacterium]|nr:protein-methionine-sulfoxide reductase catalytic subunit MsrP [Alphaproteobacteria bacterium]